MRLSTIWTIPAMRLSERLRRTRDWAASEFGAHLPLRVRYFVTMQEMGHATMKSPNVPATPLEDILQNMRQPRNLL